MQASYEGLSDEEVERLKYYAALHGLNNNPKEVDRAIKSGLPNLNKYLKGYEYYGPRKDDDIKWFR